VELSIPAANAYATADGRRRSWLAEKFAGEIGGERRGEEVMSAEAGPIRILAVDDHPVVRQGIAGLVAVHSDMSLVAEASNGREAIQQFRAHHPDVTLMDLQMPEMNGLDAIITIRGEFPESRIIVLTTYAGDVQVLRALKAGARGLPAKK